MIENIYALYDKGANTLLKPFLISRNDVAPVREIKEVVADKQTVMAKHPGDFDLMHLGSIDLETMEIQPTEIRIVARCLDLSQEQQ